MYGPEQKGGAVHYRYTPKQNGPMYIGLGTIIVILILIWLFA